MRCKQCDYPLWNLRDRKCPECGRAFRPSEFRFAANAVRFGCPRCGQGYYGTGADGHLVPRAFTCVGCGTAIDMDEMVLIPTEGVDERLTKADTNPWLDYERRFLSRWGATLYRGACTPTWLMRVTPVDTGAARGWEFAAASYLLTGVAMAIPVLALLGVLGIVGAGGAAGAFIGAGLVMLIGLAIGAALWLALWTVTAHAVLRLGGRPAGGIGRTAQALCFTCAPQLIVLVPCLGVYFGWLGTLWWVVIAGFALAAGQKVSGLRAALAVSVLPAIVGVCVLSWFVVWVAGAASYTSTTSYGVGGGPSVQAFSAPMQAGAATGRWPDHAGEFLLDNALTVYDFDSSMSPTTPANTHIGRVSLDVWDTLSPAQQEQTVAAAAEAIGPGTPAYRVGDFVFTYPGIDPGTQEKALWIVVEAWDPTLGGLPQSVVYALTPSGAVLSFPRAQMGTQLRAQNALREGYGLPPLPDPFSVRQGPSREGDDPG